MGGWAEGLVCADPVARIPISLSEIVYPNYNSTVVQINGILTDTKFLQVATLTYLKYFVFPQEILFVVFMLYKEMYFCDFESSKNCIWMLNNIAEYTQKNTCRNEATPTNAKN